MGAKARFFIVALFAVFVSIGICIQPNGSLQSFISIKKNIYGLLPVGWSFFASNNLRDGYSLYKLEKNGLTKISIKNSSSQNNYGLSRKARKLDFERQVIVLKLKDSTWNLENENNPFNGITGNQHVFKMKKPKVNTLLEDGIYLIEKKKNASPDSLLLSNVKQKNQFILVDYQ